MNGKQREFNQVGASAVSSTTRPSNRCTLRSADRAYSTPSGPGRVIIAGLLPMKYTFLIAFATLAVPELFYGQSVTISAPVNASGYQAELAPDTVFVMFGSGMGPASLVAANAPNYPASLGGTSVAFTPAAGGAAIAAKMIYSSAAQIAGLLPSSIAPGAYSVQVSFNGQTSAAQNVNVVARSFGIATASSSGSGNVQATIGNVNGGISLTRFTTGSTAFGGYNWTLSPAHPGDTLVLWGTGGGSDPLNDTGSSSGDQTAAGNFMVIVGGRPIVPLFAGASSGYPGLWQVNFTLPSDITADCFVYVQVSAGGKLSNGVNLPIASPGQTSCSEPGLTPSFLSRLDAGGVITTGNFAIARLTSLGVTQETASGFVGRYQIAKWLLPQIGPKFGFCTIFDRTFPVGGVDPASPDAELDAGSSLPLSGPNLPAGFALAIIPTVLGTFYSKSPALGTLVNGAYNLSAPGGTQVGPFNASTVFPAAFAATNIDSIAAINRTQPLTFTWTGTGVDNVYIGITTNTRTGSNQRIVTLNCTIPANLGTYTIPAAALAYLQPSPSGNVAIEGQSPIGSFTANLVPSGQLDLGIFVGDLGVTKTVPVQ